MDAVLFWVFMLLLFVTVFAWPTWPYTRDRWVYRRPGGWRYAPSDAAAGLALLMFVLFWFGVLAIAWPWAVATATVG